MRSPGPRVFLTPHRMQSRWSAILARGEAATTGLCIVILTAKRLFTASRRRSVRRAGKATKASPGRADTPSEASVVRIRRLADRAENHEPKILASMTVAPARCAVGPPRHRVRPEEGHSHGVACRAMSPRLPVAVTTSGFDGMRPPSIGHHRIRIYILEYYSSRWAPKFATRLPGRRVAIAADAGRSRDGFPIAEVGARCSSITASVTRRYCWGIVLRRCSIQHGSRALDAARLRAALHTRMSGTHLDERVSCCL